MSDTKSPKSSPDQLVAAGQFSTAAYRQHCHEISILMGNFFLRYLGQIYREFKGDLAAVIVLGEIGHHNVNHCYSGQGVTFRVHREKIKDPALLQKLHPCNAFSLSAATGVPRETVRRKIEELVSRGWLKRNAKGEVFITEAVSPHFNSEFNPRLLGELLVVAKRLRELVSVSPTESRKHAAAHKRALTRK